MAYIGTKPGNQVVDGSQIADGTITPADLSTGKPVWDTSGNVGIGTSSPGYKLDVRGDVRVGDGSSSEQDIAILSSNGSWQVGSNASGASGTNRFYIYDTNAASYRLMVDNAGRVTMPNQPAFHARVLSNSSVNSYVDPTGVYLTFSSVTTNIGGNYNSANGRFTAPVTGTYFFNCYILVDDNAGSGSVTNVQLRKNGADTGMVIYDQNPGSRYQQASASIVLSLSAGDYVQMYVYSGFVHTGMETGFCGYLIG